VRSLQLYRLHSDIQSAFADHWYFILEEINYYPIFHIAHELLSCLAADRSSASAVEQLCDAARQIVQWRASLRHDLAGRIYHRILAEAKYLGAYYTSIPSSVLLLKLALRPSGWTTNWSDLASLAGFRVADLACGTGTLLMAAADALTDNYIAACVDRQARPDADHRRGSA
jgi:hypothetical protein